MADKQTWWDAFGKAMAARGASPKNWFTVPVICKTLIQAVREGEGDPVALTALAVILDSAAEATDVTAGLPVVAGVGNRARSPGRRNSAAIRRVLAAQA
jgi:hypothetical protein